MLILSPVPGARLPACSLNFLSPHLRMFVPSISGSMPGAAPSILNVEGASECAASTLFNSDSSSVFSSLSRCIFNFLLLLSL